MKFASIHTKYKQPHIGNLSKCDTHYRYTDCGKYFNAKRYPREDHNCGEYTCNFCKQSVEMGHLCYIQKAGKKQDKGHNSKGKTKGKKEPKSRYLFYDLESMTVDQEFANV